MGSGCGAVGRAVAYDTRGPRFESSHRQLLLNIYLLLTVCRKDENKEKEAGNGPSFYNHIDGRQLRYHYAFDTAKLALLFMHPESLKTSQVSIH